MFDNGAKFDLPERTPVKQAGSANPFGSSKLAADKSKDVPNLVDHSWTEDLSEAPIFGRDVALNNTPALARFREFSKNVIEEDSRKAEEESIEINESVNRQVIDNIQDILSASLDDHRKQTKIEDVLTRAASQGYPQDNHPVVRYLRDQVGVANNLYVIAGKTLDACRSHAASLRKNITKERPLFVVPRIGSKLDKHQISIAYGLPVRDKIRLSTNDIQDLLQKVSTSEDGRKLVNTLIEKRASIAEIYRNCKVASKNLQLDSTIAAYQRKEEASKYALPVTKPTAGIFKRTNLHNMIFAALSGRNYKLLQLLASASHPQASKVGGPVAYREAVIDVLNNIKGVRIYAEDFKSFSHDRLDTRKVAGVLGLPKEYHHRLATSLQNCKIVYAGDDCVGCDELKSENSISLPDKTKELKDPKRPLLERTTAKIQSPDKFFEKSKESAPTLFRSRKSRVSKEKAKMDTKEILQPDSVLPLQNFDFADPSTNPPLS